jgi:hypothetical protein
MNQKQIIFKKKKLNPFFSNRQYFFKYFNRANYLKYKNIKIVKFFIKK